MGISALLAAQILDASATGRSVITGADASAIRTTLGLGTLATQSPTGTPSASTFLRGDYSWQTIDLSGYVPYTGATGAVNLGANDLQTSADIVIAKDRGGYTTGNIFATTAKTGANIYIDSFGQFGFYSALTGTSSIFGADTVGLMLASSRSLAWTNGNVFGVRDTVLARDGAGIIGIRNSTNAQRLNLYGTYTDASNYRRLFLSSTTAGAFTLGVEGAGTGASGNELTINLTSSTQLARIESNGGGINVRCGAGNYAYQFFQNELMPAVSGQLNLGSEQYSRQWGFVYANRFRADGLSLTGSQATSLFDATATWNTTGTPTLLKANVTDTASNANSLLMDLQVGGSSKFKVGKSGTVVIAATNYQWLLTSSDADTGIFHYGSRHIGLCDGIAVSAKSVTAKMRFVSGASIGWCDSASDPVSGTADTLLFRDAAQTLAQRNSTNAQTFRIYNTFTDSSNYERGKIAWESNVLRIGTEKAGTGSARALELQTDGVTRLTIGTAGNVTASGYFQAGTNGYWVQSGATDLSYFDIIGLRLQSTQVVAFAASTNPATSNVGISRSANGVLEVNSGTIGTLRDLKLRAIELVDGNMILGTTTGTKIGTATTQKLGFYNATPVVQPTAVADATDAASVITQLNALLSRMRDLGLIAT